jgi:Polyketide cyclase / dehydrase and lipid transport
MVTSYTFTHSVETDATPEAVWALYEDVSSWPSWDAQAEKITRDGPFEAGTTGTMTFVDQEPMPYWLTKVDPMREFVDETPVGALVVRVSHLLTPLPDGRLRIDYSAEIDGPEDQTQQVGPMITADFPETMASLIALAEERSS